MDSPLARRLLALLRAPHYRPQDVSSLARSLELAGNERAELRQLLREWEASGRVMRLRQAHYRLREAAPAPLTGRVRTLPSGKQLFVPDAEGQEALGPLNPGGGIIELPIRRFRNMGAMDGDLVRATVKRQAPVGYRRRHRGMRPEGEDLRAEARVEEILERRAGLWVGIYRCEGRFGCLIGDGKSCPEKVKLTEAPPPSLQAGMLIAVQPLCYPLARMEASGRLVEILGWPEDEGVDMLGVIRRHGLRTEFSQAVLDEASRLPIELSEEEFEGRCDCRGECVLTIDPESARDYDDAIAVRRTEAGRQLAVHIADVSHYVRPGTALDGEAALRGNSTYLPDRVLPMLPPLLCDGICSLREGENRLTLLCLMQVNDEGCVTRAEFRRAVICSRRRLTYPQALAVLESRGSSGDAEVDAMLREAAALARLMRRRRMKAGALALGRPELRVVLDADGHPTDVVTEQSDEAHRLIEEFMLAANEEVAKALRSALIPTIYRVHESPDPGKLHEFALTLRSYGIAAGTLATREELRRVMEQLAGHPDEELLKTALLRSMMRARYSVKSLGHYGLAKGDYCHFTSPIRRYADLVVHRGLARLIGVPHAAALPSTAALASLAEHISETERISDAAEQEAERLKLAEFLQMQCSAEDPRHWQAVVTAAWPQGLAVDLPELRLKGFISAEVLPGGEGWFYERHASRWSRRDGARLLPGSRLEVVPLKVDVESGFLELRPVQAPSPEA